MTTSSTSTTSSTPSTAPERIPGQLFPLGAITITEAAAILIATHAVPLGDLLRRHARGDWGAAASYVDVEEHKDNDRVLQGWYAADDDAAQASHVLSKYIVPGLPLSADPARSGHLWVYTTGAGRTAATTVCLPHEYS